jgi:transmembrane sensor
MPAPNDPAILREAADWYARLRDDAAGEAERQGWRAWLAASPAHEQAWRCVEGVLAPFATAGSASALASDTLSRARGAGRRRALQLLGFGGMAVGLGALWRAQPWQQDAPLQAAAPAPAWKTEIGQQRLLRLPDGSELHINTASAVDVDFNASLRRIVLHRGEVLLTTAPDATTPSRPLVVDTGHGRITAAGTRFGVRHEGRDTQVAVFAGAVQVERQGGDRRDVRAGQLCRFNPAAIDLSARPEPWRESWARGLLVADDVALGDFVAELRRYVPQDIRIDAAAAQLRLVAVYPIAAPARDVPAIFAALGQTLPVRVQTLPAGGGWDIRAG